MLFEEKIRSILSFLKISRKIKNGLLKEDEECSYNNVYKEENISSEKVYCTKIYNGLSFQQLYASFCTTCAMGPVLTDYKNGQKQTINEILTKREEYVQSMDKGIIPPDCKDCPWRSNESLTSKKIQRIDLFYWYHCNSGCFYCAYIDETKGKFSDEVKSGNPAIFEIISQLYKTEKIDREKLLVVCGGGEVAVLKEFPALLKLFLKEGLDFISIDSSGIKYVPEIGEILKVNKGAITIPLCAGSRETYKLIKRRDMYEKVISNMKKYLKDACKNPEKVISKYIILENANNNIQEVEKWLSVCSEIGIKKVELSIEFCWGKDRKKNQKIEDYNYQIFEYAEQRCKELNLILEKNQTSMIFLEKGTY